MNGSTQEHIRAEAARLVEKARARGNRLSMAEAEEAVRANHTLRARGIRATPAAAAIAVASVDREVIRCLTVICKVLPAIGRNPCGLKAALEGHFLPELITTEQMLPPETRRPRRAPRSPEPAWADETGY
jgi:hypothetical protein